MHAPADDQDLRARVATAVAEAQETLALAPPSGDELDRVRALQASISELLAAGRRTSGADAYEAGLEQLRRGFEERFASLARVHDATVELRELTSPSVIVEQAPAVLCRASGFRRALLSIVRDSAIVPQTVNFVDDPAGARDALTRLGDEPIQLEHPLIETELLRRRRAVLVADAQVDRRAEPRLAAVMGWSSYVAAPVLRGGAVIGIVHADRGPTERLETLDIDVVSEFADGLSRAYESAILRRTLQQEQAQMRDFLEWLGARSGVLSDARITLADEPSAPLLAPASEVSPSQSRDDRLVFDGLLTKRELDVLRLLVDGNTNKAIADALVLSDTTIKFHVNSILRKLHVANRAEAASRYLTLLGVTPP